MGPYRSPHPLPFHGYLEIGFMHQTPDLCEAVASPMTEVGDEAVDGDGGGRSAQGRFVSPSRVDKP